MFRFPFPFAAAALLSTLSLGCHGETPEEMSDNQTARVEAALSQSSDT